MDSAVACHWRGIPGGADLTGPADYTADEDDPGLQRMPELIGAPRPYRAKHAR